MVPLDLTEAVLVCWGTAYPVHEDTVTNTLAVMLGEVCERLLPDAKFVLAVPCSFPLLKEAPLITRLADLCWCRVSP